MGRDSGRSMPAGGLRTKRACSVQRDVWFYAAEAVHQSAPSGDILSRIKASDNKRLSISPSPYARQQRPKSKRLRCMLCLREMSEWVTLDNSNEESSWRKLHNHLSSVHLIICRPLREPEVPRSTPIYISSEDDGEEGQESSDGSPHPKPGKFIKTEPSTSAAAQSKQPHQFGVRSQPEPSASSRRDVRSVPKGHRKTPVDEYYSDEDSDRSEYRVMTTDEELDHYAAAGVLDPETADLSGDLDSENDSEQTDVEYTRPSAHSRMTVKTVGAALNRVRKQCRRVTAERDRLTTERKELIAERDHEVKSRRLLEGEVLRLNGEARARDEELLKQARLISELMQDARHAPAQGSDSS